MDGMDDGDGSRDILTARLIDHGAACLGYGGFSITGNIDIQSEFLFFKKLPLVQINSVPVL